MRQGSFVRLPNLMRLFGSASQQAVAGTLLIVGSVTFLLGVQASEATFPGYSVSKNTISELGAPISLALSASGVITIQQPASAIYVASLTFLCLTFLGAAILLRRIFSADRFWKVFLAFATGLLALPLSYIPYYAYSGQQLAPPLSNVPVFLVVGAVVHDAFSGLVFFFGGLSAIASRKLVAKPIDRVFTIFGVVTIGAAGLAGSGVDLGLGFGGME